MVICLERAENNTACDPVDATATTSYLASLKSHGFNLPGSTHFVLQKDYVLKGHSGAD